MFLNRVSFVAAVVCLSASSFATTISVVGIADQRFAGYISTSPNVQGNLFVEQVLPFNVNPVFGQAVLTSGTTYYINFLCEEFGNPPSMFIAGLQFINGNDYRFNDGTTNTVTDDTINFKAYATAWGGTEVAIDDLGVNGSNPNFFNYPTIPSNAHYIWTSQSTNALRRFQVKLTPVPEPVSMIALGLGVVALVRRRLSN